MAGGSALPRRDPRAEATLRDAAKVVGWGLLFWGGVEFAANELARNATAALAIEAALAEWGAGRLSITWSDPFAPEPTGAALAKRSARGAAIGLLAAAALVGASLAAHVAVVAETSLGAGLLGIGVITATLGAIRDELLLRGLVLRATRGLLPWWGGLLACGGAAAAAGFGVQGTTGIALIAVALRGVAFGALWARDRGAWLPIAANAGWTWALGSVASGGVLDVRFADGRGNDLVTLLVSAVAAGGAVAWARAAAPRLP